MFYTIITTTNNKEIHLTNGNLLNNKIVIYSANEERRLDLKFNVSYDTKTDKVKKIINEVIDNTKYVLKDKDIIVGILKHSDISITYAVKVWVKSKNYRTTHFDL